MKGPADKKGPPMVFDAKNFDDESFDAAPTAGRLDSWPSEAQFTSANAELTNLLRALEQKIRDLRPWAGVELPLPGVPYVRVGYGSLKKEPGTLYLLFGGSDHRGVEELNIRHAPCAVKAAFARFIPDFLVALQEAQKTALLELGEAAQFARRGLSLASEVEAAIFTDIDDID